MRKYLILTAISTVLAASVAAQLNTYCIRDRFSHASYFTEADIQQDLNITYATVKNYFPRPTGKVENLQMDVYAPKTTVDRLTRRPVIIIIHGGSFLTGTRNDVLFFAKEYARRGFVTATMSYRLGWGCTDAEFQLCNAACQNANLTTAMYQATQDARSASRYLVANAARFGIDTAAFFIMGASAGAITALNTVFLDKDDVNKYYPNEVAKVGLLDTVGNNLSQKPTFKGVINFCGALLNDSIISANERVQIVSFHDEFDCIVPFKIGQLRNCLNCTGFSQAYGSQALYNRQRSLNICSEINYVPSSLQHCGYPSTNVVNQSACFLKYQMCNLCRIGSNNNPNFTPTCPTVATAEITEGVAFSCQPNPATDVVRLEIPDSFEPKLPISVSVINIFGQIVFEKTYDTTNEMVFSTKTWQHGIYVVALREGSILRGSRKLVVSD